MKRRPLVIGDLTFEYPFVLAPLAGITDRSMRSLCWQAGASLTYTEMVSAKGLWYGDRKTSELLTIGPEEGPVGYQLFGHEPVVLAHAVRALEEAEASREMADADAKAGQAAGDAKAGQAAEAQVPGPPPKPWPGYVNHRRPVLYDLNAGCPVPKIVRNGEGSALLQDPDLLHDCIAAMVRESGKPVTVKIRKGFHRDSNTAVEIAKAAEAAGAAAVTVHGRTREQYYEGQADWDVIAAVKAAVKIPVIGNGDVRCGADALRMMEETGCDGVMIARGALGNPWIFREARILWDQQGAQDSGFAGAEHGAAGGFTPPTAEERIGQLLQHIDLVCADKGERMGVREMRKHIAWYTKGIRGAAQIRREANAVDNAAELKDLLRRITG